LSALSGTDIVVPSIAHTNSPRQRAAPAAGPATSPNNAANGLTPTRRRAWASAEDVGMATGNPSRPAINLAHTCR
jgi:hypothetical protein